MQVVEHRLGRSLEGYMRERYDAGATQAEIADELDLTTGAVSRWMVVLGIESRPPGPRRGGI